MRTDSHKPAPRGAWGGAGAVPALVLRTIHTVYVAAVFVPTGLAALAGMALLPTLAARRRMARASARVLLAAAGLPVSARLPPELPDPCIVVANHESYLDGIVLVAVLPPRFAIVIKREAAALPLGGWLLRRIGALFVARGRGGGNSRDSLRVLREAARGQSLAFFPEGTFREQPGLLRFHAGAFAAAERAGSPILPLAIFGTRRALPPGRPLTQPGRLRVEALGLLHPRGGTHDAATLREAAWAAIAAAVGGPAVSNDDTGTGPG